MKSKRRSKQSTKPRAPTTTDVVVPFPKKGKQPEAEQPKYSDWQVFKFRLRGGVTGLTVLRSSELDRVWSKVQAPDDFNYFIVFDSDERRMALNLRHLVASQFDLIAEDGLEAESVYEGEEVEIFFADSPKPLRLEVEPDYMMAEEFDEGGTPDEEACQVANFFTWLDSCHEDSDYAARLRTSDGSKLWFRLNDIAFASVPLSLLADHREEED